VRGLAGCTVLGDGSISLIIDVAKLIRESRVCVAA
jgi:chemotaxis protein histidine kinase CheA